MKCIVHGTKIVLYCKNLTYFGTCYLKCHTFQVICFIEVNFLQYIWCLSLQEGLQYISSIFCYGDFAYKNQVLV